MTKLWPLAALATIALIGAGCSNTPDEAPTRSSAGNEQGGEVRRVHARQRRQRVPGPGRVGRLTIDGVVNGSSLDPDGPAWRKAIGACKNLQPPGFTGDGKRSAKKQDAALEFAQCIREHGVKDFPDPANGEPLVDTRRIPSSGRPGGMTILNAAMKTCGDLVRDQVERP